MWRKLIFSIAVISVVTLSSCRKCRICYKVGEPDIRLCEGDFSSKAAYGAEIDFYEAQGFKCR